MHVTGAGARGKIAENFVMSAEPKPGAPSS